MFPAEGAGLFYEYRVTPECIISVVLKANKISETEETRKVEYAHYFYIFICLPKIIKIRPCLLKLQLAKVGAFF